MIYVTIKTRTADSLIMIVGLADLADHQAFACNEDSWLDRNRGGALNSAALVLRDVNQLLKQIKMFVHDQL